MPAPPRLVEVEWLDTVGPHATEWTDLHRIRGRPSTVFAVGYVVEDARTHLTIAQAVEKARPDRIRQGYGATTIPRGCIVRVVDLAPAPGPKSTSSGGRLADRSRTAGRPPRTR